MSLCFLFPPPPHPSCSCPFSHLSAVTCVLLSYSLFTKYRYLSHVTVTLTYSSKRLNGPAIKSTNFEGKKTLNNEKQTSAVNMNISF